ncbi:U3 snoRNP protein, partial [Coemansia aciculifera]
PASDDSYVEPLHVIVEFASSSRWPDDIAALHKIKSAFLLRLAEAYAGLHPEARVQIVNRFHGRGAADGLVTGVAPLLLGSQESMDYESDNCLDIWHAASGLTFRLSMLCECEGELLAKKARDLRLAPSLAAHAEAVELAHRRWVRNHVWRPKHHRQILDLCQRHHPAASLAIRLVKRWLSRHMLLGQPAGVSEELAELLAARVFCDVSSSAAGGLAEPAAALSGFVRCLRLLAEWRWSEDLFAVDFAADSRLLQTSDELPAAAAGDGGVWVSSGMSAAVAETLAHAFDVPKRKDCVRVATADDPEAVWWGTVSPVLTRRLRVLAAASLECINGCLAAGSDAQLPQVFTTPLTDYDFVINLCRDVVCRKYEQPPRSAFATTAKSEEEEEDDEEEGEGVEVFKNLLPSMPRAPATATGGAKGRSRANPFHQPGMVGFDPVALYMRDLVNVYGDSMLLFNDVYGGHVIAGLWNPAVASNGQLPFTASIRANIQPVLPAKSRPLVTYNAEAVVAEMARLGQGIVEDISVQQRKP